ncbi:hypothetical protein HQQ80_17045 [Microbacteriaceae bacterium VKM Ac-2855]|nr:hypothetical protein [Microbacteriaceae bacterium VKM Ac-2855]
MESAAALVIKTEALDAELIELIRADQDWIDAVFAEIVRHLVMRQPGPPHRPRRYPLTAHAVRRSLGHQRKRRAMERSPPVGPKQ